MSDASQIGDISDSGGTTLPRLEIDLDYYAAMLESSDASNTQKLEFLEALLSIMVNFVDLGFGVHPLQQARAGENRDEDGDGDGDEEAKALDEAIASMLRSSQSPKELFQQSSRNEGSADEERSP